MIQGTKVELVLKDGRMIGYFLYKERGVTWISMDSYGMYSYGVSTSDIKKVIEL